MELDGAAAWAERTFDQCELGDPRRLKRLKLVASRLAENCGKRGLCGPLGGSSAELEGGYRFVENHRVAADAILEGGFMSTLDECGDVGTILALEDTTTLSYPHQIAGSGDLGGSERSPGHGMWVHSILLVDMVSGATVGLAEQEWWSRPPASRGSRKKRRERLYEEKESFKWQRASEKLTERMGKEMSRVVSVCDREADIYEYLSWKVNRGQHFVVRVSSNRVLKDGLGTLKEEVDSWWPDFEQTIDLAQRGGPQGRVKRKVVLSVSAFAVELKPPTHGAGRSHLQPLTLNVVQAVEERPKAGKKPVHWILYTTEPIQTRREIEWLLEAYRKRWQIEEFHKSWKTGCKVEELRLRSADNIKRAATILAFVAVRLLQLRHSAEQHPERPCSTRMSTDEWQCLWIAVEKSKVPDAPPTIAWAHEAIVRLAGSYSSKNKSRVGWLKFWTGWQRFQDILSGWMLMKSHKNFC